MNQLDLNRGLFFPPLRLLYDTDKSPDMQLKRGQNGVKAAGKGSGKALFSPSASGLALLFV